MDPDHDDLAWIRSLATGVSDARYDSLQTHLLDSLRRTGGRAMLPPWVDAETVSDEAIDRGLIRFLESSPDSLLQQLFERSAHLMVDHGTAPLPASLMMVQLPVPSLNGFAIRAPSGTPVIVLNHGLISYAAYAAHLVLGLTGFNDGRYCPHHEPPDFFDGLLDLGAGIITNAPALLVSPTAGDCLGGPEHEDTAMLHEGTCLLMEQFVMLHELAHVALGHLDPADTSTHELAAAPGTTARVFRRDHEKELAADELATTVLLAAETASDPGMASSVLHAIGAFLVLGRVVELSPLMDGIDTHPRSAERWAALSASFPRTRPTMVDSIDALFDFFDRVDGGSD